MYNVAEQTHIQKINCTLAQKYGNGIITYIKACQR